MGLEVGGYEDRIDWPKLGPSLLVATCLILAIRTAKWAVKSKGTESDRDLEREIDFAAHMAGSVLAALTARKPQLFPTLKKPWYTANDDDTPK